ncbi:flagellar filament capping protein FliD [Geoalkalibacter halelectricus]|uniref:flagellar filament capping protein FliD n=1 Tax=Geoalkalibacter halelectricus TaxID=2847045 RepID=UPI003D1D364B
MSIQIGGLATGLDTNSLISQLLKAERKPIERLERDRSFLRTRLSAFTDLDKKLRDLMAKAEGLDSARKLVANQATPASEEYFKVSASATAMPGSYNINVVSLAKRAKEVTQGYADISAKEFGTGSLSVQVGSGEAVQIQIDENNNSLGGIRDAINAAGAGVKAAIINDGDPDNPYRLVITADDAGTPVELSANLSGGSYADPLFTQTQEGTRAHIQVDGIDIYRTSNTITEAIPGVTIDLLKEHGDATASTGLQVDLDVDAVEKKIREFVTAYNDIISFVAKQNDASWGRDAGMQAPRRNLQMMVSSAIGGDNSLQALTQLGMETQRDGSLRVDATKLKDAIRNDLDGVIGLFAGSGEVEGVATKFKDYLKGVTDRSNGILAGRKQMTDSSLRRIDQQIERQELRLEQRERTLRAQFTAMEELVSAMSATSSYLMQQMSMISSLGSKK